jgi:hypothetical protein
MTSVAHHATGFTTSALYQRPYERASAYLSERATFWIAVVSVFAFVTGNMVGQHGWSVFWKSVLGEGSDAMVAFDGTVTPIALIPDYDRWAKVGGDVRYHTFKQVPTDVLVPLPSYTRDDRSDSHLQQLVYQVKNLGTYETGRGEGSHPGVDISVPVGTPIRSMANGIVVSVKVDSGGYGKYVTIRHPNVPDADHPGTRTTVFSTYAHLSSQLVAEGQVVRKGEQIGLSGQTGFATGPHLHFQLDRASAPWHPYWLFTTNEAQQKGWSFTQAVDGGLYRERGIEHTLDPMLFAQSYVDGAPVTRIASVAQSSVQTAPKRSVTTADRRQQRLVRLASRTTLVAYTDEAPVVPVPEHTAAPAESSMSSAVASTASARDVASVGIEWNAGRTHERQWQSVTLTLLDTEGGLVTNPTLGRKMVLRPAFGRAEIKPSAFSVADFRGGKLTVQVLPQSSQTLVLELMPYGSLSKPMRVEK